MIRGTDVARWDYVHPSLIAASAHITRYIEQLRGLWPLEEQRKVFFRTWYAGPRGIAFSVDDINGHRQGIVIPTRNGVPLADLVSAPRSYWWFYNRAAWPLLRDSPGSRRVS